MDTVSSTSSTLWIIAIAAGAVAVVALALALSLLVGLRRVRAAQRVVLGEHQDDLVAHAAHLQESFEALAGYVEDTANTLSARVEHAELRLDSVFAHRGLVRYDAYGEMSGQQSTSIALLDSHRDGFVISSIHHRDQARLYIKRVTAGAGEFELSPEEQEAIDIALAQDEGHGPPPSAPPTTNR